MASFEFTVNRNVSIGGNSIAKGTCYHINISQIGVTPGNLFNNPERIKSIANQLSAQGLIIDAKSPFLNRGTFDIKMR